LRDAIVFGTRTYVLDVLLDPETVIGNLTGMDTNDEAAGSTP
jgi:hypothetical protein